MAEKLCSLRKNGGGRVKIGSVTLNTTSDDTVITDIGFEPKIFSAWCEDGSRFEVTYDDYTNNIHTYGVNTGSAEYCRKQSMIQAKSASSITWRTVVSALRGKTMYYSAIG